MAAVVSNLHHDVSADVVGLLWVVSYVVIRRVVYQTIGDAFHAEWVGVPRPPIRFIMGE